MQCVPLVSVMDYMEGLNYCVTTYDARAGWDNQKNCYELILVRYSDIYMNASRVGLLLVFSLSFQEHTKKKCVVFIEIGEGLHTGIYAVRGQLSETQSST